MTNEQEQNVFDEMNENEFSEDVPTAPVVAENEVENEKEIMPSLGETYIKNPGVGESVEFTIAKIVENPRTEGTNSTTGEKFIVGLKRKDGTIFRNDIVTTENERFTISSWGLFFSIMGKTGALTQHVREKGLTSYANIKIKITHNYNGSYANKKAVEVALLEEWKTESGEKDLVRAQKYIDEVATAMKENRIYTVEILSQ